MSIGPAEIIIVLIIALLVFGPKRLPQMGKSLGRGVREFKKAAETAKTELGLGEVTEGINDIKSTFTDPVKEVTGTFTDLKKSVDVKSAIEAPVGASAVAGAAAAGAGEPAGEAAATPDTPAMPGLLKPKAAPAQTPGVVDAGPETPDVTPATVFADVTPPPAPEAPPAEAPPETPAETAPLEAPVAGAPATPQES